jgi:hypothetical protein
MSLLPVGISGEGAGYQIERSLRFNSADTANLNRTPGSAGSASLWTWSGWVKRGSLASSQTLFSAGSSTAGTGFRFTSGDSLEVYRYNGSAFNYRLITTQVFRDPSAWYSIVIAFDSGQGTASNRLKIYVNGVEVTIFSTATYPTASYSEVNGLFAHRIGASYVPNEYLNGYLTEINWIDGQALTPSSFGETDTDTGVWKPKKYTGTYGTNGFYLNFSDNSGTTSTTLGKDSSGNGNNWTPNLFSVTAGVNNDSLVDTPTPYGTDTGVGGEVRGNYATLNPLSKSSYISLVNGNLDSVGNTSTDSGTAGSTFGVKSGKWYVEFTPTVVNNNRPGIGILPDPNANFANADGDFSDTTATCYFPNGTISFSGANTSYTSWTANDVIGIALDCDNGAVYISKNGTWQNSGVPTSGASRTGAIGTWTAGTYTHFFAISQYNTTAASANFGQRPFSYTAPTGFKALCTQNLPTPTIKDGGEYFSTVLWTGNGSSTIDISGVGFQPDFVWAKRRSAADGHGLFDAVRGTNLWLQSNTTGAETDFGGNFGLLSFNSDGYTMGNGSSVNALNATYVGWNWKANGSGVSNTDGTITSTVSVNTTSGFSIVTYTGNGTSGATIGHGLGVAPAMTIIKRRSSTETWIVWHTAFNSAQSNMRLEQTSAVDTSSPAMFNNTFPTSTLITLGNGGFVNTTSETYVCYAFAPVAGYSAFGSYTGNGSTDGPMVYTGFRPAFVMVKSSNATNGWVMFNSANLKYNLVDNDVEANDSRAEVSGSTRGMDWLSNGFKLRSDFGSRNGSGTTYIYMAFASSPFQYSLAR